MESTDKHYTLHYFPVYVRAEAIRMIIHHAKSSVGFTDRVVPMEDWRTIKDNEFGGA